MQPAPTSASASGLRCLCGAPVPPDLPARGEAPAACRVCGTPLVRPSPVPNWRVQRAFGAACFVAIACALFWLGASLLTGTGAPIVVALAGGLVGIAARFAGRARGTSVQLVALGGFLLFVLFGEALLFQKAFHNRLVAMHAEEGASDPEIEARREIESLEHLDFTERVGHYLRVEVTLGFFLALAAGGGLALLVTRAPPAVAAFEDPRRRPTVPRPAPPDVPDAAPPPPSDPAAPPSS